MKKTMIFCIFILMSILTYSQDSINKAIYVKVTSDITFKVKARTLADNVGESLKNKKILLIDYKENFWLASYNDITGFINEIFVTDTKESKELKDSLIIRNKKEDIERENKNREIRDERLLLEDVEREEAYKIRKNVLIDKYGINTALKIIDGRIWVGMTESMARESWGYPQDINRTVSSRGVSEQWVYRGNVYLYFEDGKLTTYQD